MKFPIANWSVQSAISFGGDLSGAVATAVGADDAVYFAMSAKGAYPTPPPGMALGVPLVTQGLYTVFPGAFPVMTPDYADSLTNPARNPSFNIVIGKISAEGAPQWILVSPVLITTTDESQPALAVGPANELYVVYGTQGATYGNLNAQSIPLFCNPCRGAGPYDIVLARIDEVGGQPSVTWVKQNGELNSCNNETVPKIAIDSINRALYVAWQCNQSIACFPSVGSPNLLLSCFRLSDGKQLWIEARTNLNSTGRNTNPTVAVDNEGGVYIAFETTAQVQGGAVPPSQQIELIRYQTTFTAPGVVSRYRRDWIYSGSHSGAQSLFASGPSQSPVVTFSKTGILLLAFSTFGTIPGGTHTTSTNDMVVAGVYPNGTLLWINQGPVYNHNAVRYADCRSPQLSSDSYGNVYCSLTTSQSSPITTSSSRSLFVFHLNPFNGIPQWHFTTSQLAKYNAYPYAFTVGTDLGPNSVFPSGAFPTSPSVAIQTGSLYIATVVPPGLAPPSDTHTGALHDVCVTKFGIGNYALGQTAYEYMIDFEPTQMDEAPPSLIRRRP